jgi:hypothetical protein
MTTINFKLYTGVFYDREGTKDEWMTGTGYGCILSLTDHGQTSKRAHSTYSESATYMNSWVTNTCERVTRTCGLIERHHLNGTQGDRYALDVYSAIPNVVNLGKKLTSVFNEIRGLASDKPEIIDRLIHRKLQRKNRTKMDGHDDLYKMMKALLSTRSTLGTSGILFDVHFGGLPQTQDSMRSAVQLAHGEVEAAELTLKETA